MDDDEIRTLLDERRRAWSAWEDALDDLMGSDAAQRPVVLGAYRAAREHFFEVHERLEARLIALLRSMS